MAKGVPKSTSSATTLLRDLGAIGGTLLMGAIGREIGSGVALFVAPAIAKSSAGKNFAQGLAGLTLFDNLFSRMGTEAI